MTTITVLNQPVEPSGKRFGINLGEQNFYDSGQIMANLVYRNPGFEGLEYRSIVKCANPRGHSCDDANTGAAWGKPEAAGFWSGARYEFLSGKSAGKAGTLADFAVVPARFTFAGDAYPSAGDSFMVTKYFPGDPTAGWWPHAEGAASFTVELHDLAPKSPGKQALRITATAAGARAELSSYFDSHAEGAPNEHPQHSFLRMHGRYQLRFRAKLVSGSPSVQVQVGRGGAALFLDKRVPLTAGWQDYSVPFTSEDDPANFHTVGLRFTVAGSTILLDDVSLTADSDAAGNPTALREPVVRALREYHPGVLRLMASGQQLGSSIQNLLAQPEARARSGYSAWNLKQEDIPIGIPEFLQLCQTLSTEPWITLPTATTPADAVTLMQYMNARSANNLKAWVDVFPKIHLELGNETWNSVFQGETMEDAAAYGQHADAVFRAIRATPGFQAGKFDLVIGGQSEWPQRNQAILAAAGSSYDSLAIGPYIWRTPADAPNDDALFGPAMAEPELTDLYGEAHQNAAYARAAKHPAQLDIYEVNLHSTQGTASQATLDRTVPSLAGGLAVAAHMLMLRRDDGAQTQMLFNLPEFENATQDGKSIRLWGAVVDMGVTDRRRPAFLTLALANQLAAGTMLRTEQSGANPTWQAALKNGQAENVHAIQSFAFDLSQSHELGLLVLNLSSKPQTVRLGGLWKTGATVDKSTLSAASPASNNEDSEQIVIAKGHESASASLQIVLQPYSMTRLLAPKP